MGWAAVLLSWWKMEGARVEAASHPVAPPQGSVGCDRHWFLTTVPGRCGCFLGALDSEDRLEWTHILPCANATDPSWVLCSHSSRGALGDQPIALLWDARPHLSFQGLGAWDVGLSQP